MEKTARQRGKSGRGCHTAADPVVRGGHADSTPSKENLGAATTPIPERKAFRVEGSEDKGSRWELRTVCLWNRPETRVARGRRSETRT